MDDFSTGTSNIVANYIKEDFGEWLIIAILSCSFIGIPIMMIGMFVKALSLGVTVSALIHASGVGYGMSFSILVFMVPVIIKIFMIVLMVCSSWKFLENILKYQKEVKYEVIRHAFVLFLALLLICILALYRVFSLNLVNQILLDW